MRFILVCFLVCFSFNSFARNWRELEELKTYELTQEFILKIQDRSSSQIHVLKGEKLLLKEIEPIPPVKVFALNFKYSKCSGRDLTSTMEIIPVQGTFPVVEVGAQLYENCELTIFVEAKDLFKKSFFK